MRYHSFSSNREKEYLIEPYRLVFAQGGLYVVAFVPEYRQLRTFAVDRIRSLSVTEERFEPIDLPEERSPTRSASIRVRPNASKSCSSRASRATSRNASGTRRSRPRRRPTAR